MNPNKPITDYNEIELKALGYDFLIQKETLEKNIQLVQDELSRRSLQKKREYTRPPEEQVIGEMNHEELQKKIEVKK